MQFAYPPSPRPPRQRNSDQSSRMMWIFRHDIFTNPPPFWTIIAGIFCCPCFAVFATQEGVRQHKQKATWPTPLRKKRRPLSLTRWSQKTNPNQTGFLDLPIEIRMMIYEHLLGGESVHLEHMPEKKRLAHFATINAEDLRSSGLPRRKMQQNLALGKSCRQIYVETINILYARNAFVVENWTGLWIFGSFCRTVRPIRLEIIRSLSISIRTLESRIALTDPDSKYHAPEAIRQWSLFWRMVAEKLKGLRQLSLVYQSYYYHILGELTLNERWIRPVLVVKGLDNFDFQLTEPRSPAYSEEAANRLQYEMREVMCVPR